jgi:hypothetical protein
LECFYESLKKRIGVLIEVKQQVLWNLIFWGFFMIAVQRNKLQGDEMSDETPVILIDIHPGSQGDKLH